MASEMVERVARAIYLSPVGGSDPFAPRWEDIRERDKEAFRNNARAAIAAMREPTEAMIDAGCEAGFRASGDKCRDENCEPPSWQAMIDESLT